MTPDRTALIAWAKEQAQFLLRLDDRTPTAAERKLAAKFDAIATHLEQGAAAVEEVARLNLELKASLCSLTATTNALAALRAVIQQELERPSVWGRDGADESLRRIIDAAGLWPKGEQAPTVTVSAGASAGLRQVLTGDSGCAVLTLTTHEVTDLGLSGRAFGTLTRPDGATELVELLDDTGRLHELFPERPQGEQVPGHKQVVSCEHTQVVPDYTPNDKLFAAADLERVMVEIPDMLRAEFDVVKKAIAMVEARRNGMYRAVLKPNECAWLGDLLAVLKGGE